MIEIRLCVPVMTYICSILSEHETVLNSYLFRIFGILGIAEPFRLFVSVIFQQISGVGYQSHYREIYPEIKACRFGCFSLYGVDKIRDGIGRIKDRMLSWKLIMFQSFVLRNRCPGLRDSDGEMTADSDVTTIRSSSSRKEGAEIGYNKKNKGKPCFQLSATFIGRVLTDAKLFPGDCNPKDFFRKAVRRAISLGYRIRNVRADSAYMTLENLLFLKKRHMGYAIGAPASFEVVREGIRMSEKLARRKSPAIISVSEGISVYDFGQVTLRNGVETRIVIIRRISRRKNRKTGKWKIRTYYYAIATNLSLSPRKLYEFYHKRQRIEAGFRELKQHWNLERLPFETLVANEFWIISKIIAMTLFKIFQIENFPKSHHRLLRKTFFRKIFGKNLRTDSTGKVEAVPKTRYTVILRRLLCKTEQLNYKLCN